VYQNFPRFKVKGIHRAHFISLIYRNSKHPFAALKSFNFPPSYRGNTNWERTY